MNRRLIRFLSIFSQKCGLTSIYMDGIRKIRPDRKILYYHRIISNFAEVSPGSCYRLTGELVPLDVFEQQVEYIFSRYKVVTLEEIVRTFYQKKSSHDHMAVISFDDGYREVYKNAFRILKKWNCPATVFIPGDVLIDGEDFRPLWIDKLFYLLDNTKLDNFQLFDCNYSTANVSQKKISIRRLIISIRKLNRKEREGFLKNLGELLEVKNSDEILRKLYITVDQIKEMQEFGISFQPHSMSHGDLGQVPVKEVEEEIIKSKEILELITGKPCRFFSYPFGETNTFNDNCLKILKENNFIAAVTIIEGNNYNIVDSYKLKRILMPGDENYLFKFRISGLSTFLLKLSGREK